MLFDRYGVVIEPTCFSRHVRQPFRERPECRVRRAAVSGPWSGTVAVSAAELHVGIAHAKALERGAFHSAR